MGDGLRLIAPYWADVDTRKSGKVWFREINDTNTLSRIQLQVEKLNRGNSFHPEFALIVTWDRVGYYSEHYDLVSNRHIILVWLVVND